MAASPAVPRVVLPGDVLGESTRVGSGTHITGGSVASSLAGTLFSSQPQAAPASTASAGKAPSTTRTSVGRPFAPPLPAVHSIVLGRVLRLRTREAHISLDVVDGRAASSSSSLSSSTNGNSSGFGSGAAAGAGGGEPFAGIIRVQDVRATEKDRVRIAESFRVGDVVRAEVVGVGDERAYLCSTARNELGVVLAVGEGGEGNALYARSWREMVDREGYVERRKVAKPG